MKMLQIFSGSSLTPLPTQWVKTLQAKPDFQPDVEFNQIPSSTSTIKRRQHPTAEEQPPLVPQKPFWADFCDLPLPGDNSSDPEALHSDYNRNNFSNKLVKPKF